MADNLYNGSMECQSTMRFVSNSIYHSIKTIRCLRKTIKVCVFVLSSYEIYIEDFWYNGVTNITCIKRWAPNNSVL